MKVLAVLLLCAFVAVQGRSAGGQSTKALSVLGENPWVVHLRIAVSTSGLLNTGAGSLIASNWVLTSAAAIRDQRFIWIRYGAPNVVNPQLVTETSSVRVFEDIGLIAINRIVQTTDNIAPVPLAISNTAVDSGKFCGYGANDAGDAPGESLSCYQVDAAVQEDGSLVAISEEGAATSFDLGAPLVADGVQVGVLVAAGDDSSAGTFLAVAKYIDWIENETGLVFNPDAVQPEPEPEPESLMVKFVN